RGRRAARRDRRRRRGPAFTQRGVALIAVATALTILAVLSKEFATNTQVDAFGADNARDQMRAEFLARSSLDLSELILRLQQVLDNPQVQQAIGAVQITDYADLLMSAFGGTAEEVAGTVGSTGEKPKGLGADIGAFGVRIVSDDGKINVNCANGKREYSQLVYTLVEALYYFPAFDPVFQDPAVDGSPSGWRRDRATQTQAIIDYIDEDSTKVSPPGEPPANVAEDYGYEGLRDKYRAKNNYLDTLDELKLVRGVDDRFWTLFGPAFTVYGGCKLNVRALEDPRIIAAIIFLTAKNKEDPAVRDGNLLWMHAQAVAWARQNGFFFNSTQDFVDFVKDPEGQLGAGLTDPSGQGGSGGSTQAPTIQIPGVPPGVDLGVELDPTEVDKILRAGPQRTYRLEVWGEITRQPPFTPLHREMTAVWDMGTVNVNQRSTDAKARNGAWVYLRSK
ncbi:MAG: general secretion pathway protein GspK, partial [Myxococcales bacterium]|nr:general secretion pathway protein GspK [Myxococcales bacterium]